MVRNKLLMNNKFLKFLKFSQLTYWTAKRYFAKELQLTNKYPKVLMGFFLSKSQPDIINIKDEDRYKIIGVRSYGKGAFINREVIGQQLTMKKYQLTKANQLIWCKVDTKNGAFGIVNNELANSYASSNMCLVDIDNSKILNQYLQLLFTSQNFQRYLDSFVSGTTNRKYIKLDELLNSIEVPLPPIKKQKEIVEKYNAKIKLAEEQEQKIKILEKEIEDLWTNTLGLEFVELNSKETKTSFLNFAFLSQLTRWDIYNNTNDVKSIKYKFSKLKDIVIGKPLYGAGEKGVKNKSDVRYIRITDINEDGTLNDDFVSAQKVDEKYILRENDFLIARSGNTVGKTFLYKREHGKCIYAGYLIKFKLNLEKVIPEYLLYYTKSKAYKTWISSNQRANAQPNINSEEFLNSPVIIPELSEQKNIVDQIGKIKQEIQYLKGKDKNIIRKAQQQFEKELFE